MDNICYIDFRSWNLSENFALYNIWGKKVYKYVIETVAKSGIWDEIMILTDNRQIEDYVKREFGLAATKEANINADCLCYVSGGAVMLKAETLKRAYETFKERHYDVMYSAVCENRFKVVRQCGILDFQRKEYERMKNAFVFYRKDAIGNFGESNCLIQGYLLENNEGLVINSSNEFELAIVLKKKELSKVLLKENILKQIELKMDVLSNREKKDGICLIGHSQIDQWKMESLAGEQVRNCGISGISSFEYNEFILRKNLLDCSENRYLVMHGTNDIVTGYGDGEICNSIGETITYIREHNPNAEILFLACIHTNGRMDRENRRIDRLNATLNDRLPDSVKFISMRFLDNGYGELDEKYTTDGLHISPPGYGLIKEHIEGYLNGRSKETS